MKPGSVGCVFLLLAGCGSSSGLSSFANAYAASYCHFAYHCCTPSDRANPQNPFEVTSGSEEILGFDSEDGCATSLGVIVEVDLQPYEDSVAAKRISYNQAEGQACLSAVAAAASSCDPNAFLATAQDGGACYIPAFFTGLASASADCTMDADCAAANSICARVDAGMGGQGEPPEVITGAATCVSPAAVGMTCLDSNCAVGSCCSYMTATCLGYVAEGAMCDFSCESSPCDPSSDYCDAMGTGVCQPLIANGGACNTYYDGTDCVGFDCVPNGNGDGMSGTCKSASTAEVIQICVGNPNGF